MSNRKSRRKELLAFVPDDTAVDLDTLTVVVEEAPEETESIDAQDGTYLCMNCFRQHVKSDLDKRNMELCPDCGEEAVQEQ